MPSVVLLPTSTLLFKGKPMCDFIEMQRTRVDIPIIWFRNIGKLPRTMIGVGESVEDQTGWFGTMMLGGPAPGEGGKIKILVYVPSPAFGYQFLTLYFSHHFGKTADGEDFEGYLGKNVYHAEIVSKFDEFLHEAFRK